MGLNEADTRARLIDPILHARGWIDDFVRREETAGEILRTTTGTARRGRKRLDYLLRVHSGPGAQLVAVSIFEAKKEDESPGKGLEQAKAYAAKSQLHHVPFVHATNGHLFVEFDRTTGKTTDPRPLSEFPTPEELRARYEAAAGFSLDDVAAAPLSKPYQGGESDRRYYQDAAVRAALEAIARGQKRMLMSLATGSGKTYLAALLLRRIADAGQLRRALFLCDRDELRTNAVTKLHGLFGADAAPLTRNGQAKNAKVQIATYQTLGLDAQEVDESEAVSLLERYPIDYFSHIIVDECHRSAWGKWSGILKRNPNAIQIGLTATPRQLKEASPTTSPSSGAVEGTEGDAFEAGEGAPTPAEGAAEDAEITADNIRYFGDPIYEYTLEQGRADGYLAACDIIERRIFFDGNDDDETVTGLTKEDLESKDIRDPKTGERLVGEALREWYKAQSFERRLRLPDRVKAMCTDLFEQMTDAGTPEQKTIVFCASEAHADAVVVGLNNLYADWCAAQGSKPAASYAFKCMSTEGADAIGDLRGASGHHFIAVTVDLLSTGVDIPWLRNVVFFRFVRSPIALHQMIGRGTRVDERVGKLSFRVYDYTKATEIYGQPFVSRAKGEPAASEEPSAAPESVIEVAGIQVGINAAGRWVLAEIDGREVRLSLEEYRERMAAKAMELAPTLEQYRTMWISPPRRKAFMAALPEEGRSVDVLREINGRRDYDDYDIIGEAAYGLAGRTRVDRERAFHYKQESWLGALPPNAKATLEALTSQFVRGGTRELENLHIFATPEVVRAGGIGALAQLGSGASVLRETKERLFSA